MTSSARRLLATALLLFITAACGGDGPSTGPGLQIVQGDTAVLLRRTLPLTATLDGAASAARGPVTWQSLDPLVASVSLAGGVTGVSIGTTAIVARLDPLADTVQVRVIPQLWLAPGPWTMLAGDTVQLRLVVTDGDGMPPGELPPVEWSSSSPGTARVTPDAIVHGRSEGAVRITADINGAQASVNVTVIRRPSTTNGLVGWRQGRTENRNGAYDFWVAYPDGRGARQVSAPGMDVYSFDWSPDGERVALALQRPQNAVVMNLDGSDVRDLGVAALTLDWAPDGETLVLNSPDGDLYTVRADGSALRMIRPRYAYVPLWSPDGTRILISSPGNGLRIINADGSGEVALPGIQPEWGLWSPDGKWVVFQNWSQQVGAAHPAMLYRVADRKLFPLFAECPATTCTGSVVPLQWLSDNRSIVVLIDGRLALGDYTTGALTAFTPVPGMYEQAWSPDRQLVAAWTYHEWPDTTWGVAIAPADGGPFTRISPPRRWTWGHAWQPRP